MTFDPYQVVCCECGEAHDERVTTMWAQVTGWEKRRAQGGTNHVALRRPTGQFMCGGCMTLRLADVDPNQLTIGTTA